MHLRARKKYDKRTGEKGISCVSETEMLTEMIYHRKISYAGVFVFAFKSHTLPFFVPTLTGKWPVRIPQIVCDASRRAIRAIRSGNLAANLANELELLGEDSVHSSLGTRYVHSFSTS